MQEDSHGRFSHLEKKEAMVQEGSHGRFSHLEKKGAMVDPRISRRRHR
jgi:hypothetical protein